MVVDLFSFKNIPKWIIRRSQRTSVNCLRLFSLRSEQSTFTAKVICRGRSWKFSKSQRNKIKFELADSFTVTQMMIQFGWKWVSVDWHETKNFRQTLFNVSKPNERQFEIFVKIHNFVVVFLRRRKLFAPFFVILFFNFNSNSWFIFLIWIFFLPRNFTSIAFCDNTSSESKHNRNNIYFLHNTTPNGSAILNEIIHKTIEQ